MLIQAFEGFRYRTLLHQAMVVLLLLGGCATEPQAPLNVSSSLMGDAMARESDADGKPSSKDAPGTKTFRRPRLVVLPEGSRNTEALQIAGTQVRNEATGQRFAPGPFRRTSVGSSFSGHDLWARLRQGFSMPDLNTPLVQERVQWYTTRPEHVQRMAERGSRYLFHIIEEVAQRGMPAELALLPFIESSFNPQALSSAQFIPTTGSAYDLRQNIFRDDRREVLASTRAALDYLSKLYGMFGDWHLALAAYNWGEGNVQRAINNNQKAGLPTDYLSLRMPEETRQYLPKLQAVKNIVAQPEIYGLRLPTLGNHPYFVSVPIEHDMDVDVAIELSGVSRDEFVKLNPQFNTPVIFAALTPQLLLPNESARQFSSRLNQHDGPLASWTAWTAPRTMSLAEVAQEFGLSESSLRRVNAVPPTMWVNRGSTLLVPRAPHKRENVSLHVADNAVMSLTPATLPRLLTSPRSARGTVALNTTDKP
jgi:membrane-bound lytic murein transglycosylase D